MAERKEEQSRWGFEPDKIQTHTLTQKMKLLLSNLK